LLDYTWPNRVRVTTVVLPLVGAAALVALAVLMADQPPTCGGVRMNPGDLCDFNGSVATSSDLANSPLPAVTFAAAAVLVGWLVMHVRKQRKPSRLQIHNFEGYVTMRRRALLREYDSTPDWRAKWATQDELLAAFEKEAERQRKRRRFSASQVKA
jgi:hypothetical protein